MKITKKELEELRNNPFAKMMASMYNYDLNDLIKEAEKEIEEETPKQAPAVNTDNLFNPFSDISKRIQEALDKRVADGTLSCREEKGPDGTIHKYYSSVQKPEENKAKTDAKTNVPNFVMSKSQFVKFIRDYRSVVDAIAKINYLYGIDFSTGESGFSLVGKTQEIIWDFIRIIFGDDNAEDIADYIYGNSNFDSAEKLYEELL